MTRQATLIPGDGIGPEVIEAARRCVEATGADIAWDRRELGTAAYIRSGDPLPAATLESIREHGVALKGPVVTPAGWRNVNVELRKRLDLFANVRPCRRYPGVESPYGDVDLVVIRENTEDMYTGYEFDAGSPEVAELIGFLHAETGQVIREDSGLSIKAITRRASERIATFAFAWARDRGRRKITAGHKANIMKFSDGLFLEVARQVAAGHPDVEFEGRIIDALCMQLVQRPERFDVLLLPNLYGDVASELGAGLIGGAAMAPGGHFGGPRGRELAVFEATHGTAPKLAGRGVANPIGAILSGAMLLRHIGETEAGDRLETAVAAVLAAGDVTPHGLHSFRGDHPAAGTEEVTSAVLEALAV